jgi:hypothetical protein
MTRNSICLILAALRFYLGVETTLYLHVLDEAMPINPSGVSITTSDLRASIPSIALCALFLELHYCITELLFPY